MQSKSLINLILYFGIFGNFLYFLGLFGQLKLFPSIAILLTLTIKYIRSIHPNFRLLPIHYFLFTTILITQSLVNLLGIFIPETSFDAIWYHLPEAQVYAATGKIAKIPELMYSTMPRLGEMYYAFGYLFHSPLIVKIISFIFSLLFVALSYVFARQFLDKKYSLLLAVVVNSMFIISWQSTAGYVDIIAALFQLASLLTLILFTKDHKSYLLFLSSIFMGFALSTKIQSFILLPASVLFLILNKKRLFTIFLFLITTALCAAPWYLDNYLQSGSPLYPTTLPSLQIEAINHAGFSSQKDFIIYQLTHIYQIPYHLSLTDLQFTPIILLLLPLLVFKSNINKYYSLYSYIIVFLILFWLLPPPEPRYALGIIPPLLTILFIPLSSIKNTLIKKTYIFTIFSFIFLNLAIRIYTTKNNLFTTNFIEKNANDLNRQKIQLFYSSYWQKYRYPSPD